MGMSVRFEVFPNDLEATRVFYTEVLGFVVVRYQHDSPGPYLSMQRDAVTVGAALRLGHGREENRRPPTGVEVVLEVDDVRMEYHRVAESGWPIAEPLCHQAWGLCDFRLEDPSGYYLRITSRPADVEVVTY